MYIDPPFTRDDYLADIMWDDAGRAEDAIEKVLAEKPIPHKLAKIIAFAVDHGCNDAYDIWDKANLLDRQVDALLDRFDKWKDDYDYCDYEYEEDYEIC